MTSRRIHPLSLGARVCLVLLLSLGAWSCSDDGGRAPSGEPADQDVAPEEETTDLDDVTPDIEEEPGDDDDASADADAEEEDAEEQPEPPADTSIVVPGAEGIVGQFEDLERHEGGPQIVYPEDGTVMPGNITAPLIQWTGAEGASYRLRLITEHRIWEVFTTKWSFEPDEGLWRSIVNNAGGRGMTLQVAKVENAQVLQGPASRLEVTTGVVEGAIYYWAPNQAAIVRLPMGETQPEPWVTGTVVTCAGCHALSPDGERIAYTRGSGTPIGRLGVMGTDDARTIYQPESLDGYYPSFAPDSIRIAVARNNGITVINTDTGRDEVSFAPIAGTTAGTHPAWHPMNEAIVYAAGSSGIGGAMGALGISQSGLARIPTTDTGFGRAEWLVEQGEASNPGETLFYPAYSPDGDWVVFNRADSAVGAGSSPPGSELWLAHDRRRVSPVFLERAQGPPGTTNSWPKFAPGTTTGRLWIAFTSRRPYGRIEPGGSQIWITSVSIADALAGLDPSAPAYRLPFQDLSVDNHVAYWAEFRKE